jgi:rhodanese-related sulfurtransferase
VSPVYTGSAPVTLGVFPPATVATGLVDPPLLDATPDYTVFEGHLKGARALNYLELFVDGPKKDYTFLPEKTLKEKIAAVGAGKAKPTYVYCRTGYIASISFFILDGVLGWPVKLYDGSWSQWGQMSGEAAKGGKLPADSKWRTDTAAMTEPSPIMYNLGRTVKVKTQTDPKAPAVATDKDFSLSPAHIESVTLDEKALKKYKPASPRASQIEREDAAYMKDRTN